MQNLEPTDDLVTKTYAVPLTQAELLTHAKAMAACNERAAELEAEAKAAAAVAKDEVAAERSAMRKHSSAISKGSEDREVVCRWFADYTAKQFVLLREDTGQQVDAKTMTADDLQLRFGNPEQEPQSVVGELLKDPEETTGDGDNAAHGLDS